MIFWIYKLKLQLKGPVI